MICLASLPIKACWGNVAVAARRLTEGSVVFTECRLLFVATHFARDQSSIVTTTKGSGHWPGLLDM